MLYGQTGGEMGRQIPSGDRVMAPELGTPDDLFPLRQVNPQTDLHHQHDRGFPPSGSESDQDQGGFYFRYGPIKAHLSGPAEHQEKMDDAVGQLGSDSPTAGNLVSRKNGVGFGVKIFLPLWSPARGRETIKVELTQLV